MSEILQLLVFDDVELLDFCGPYEVFSAANEVAGTVLFELQLVAMQPQIRSVRNGLRVQTDFPLEEAPEASVLLIPGGTGARLLLDHAALVDWIGVRGRRVPWLLSVCTGALLLAKAGLLKGKRATTHHSRLELLRALEPTADVTGERVVDNGRLILSAGIASGIDMSLHVLARMQGSAIARAAARYMEYPWDPDEA